MSLRILDSSSPTPTTGPTTGLDGASPSRDTDAPDPFTIPGRDGIHWLAAELWSGTADDELLDRVSTRRLDHAEFRRLYLDASYMKSRSTDGVRFEAVVATSGVRVDGEVEILGIDIGDSEDHGFWLEVLVALKVRGLRGVRIVGSDEHGGLAEALDAVFPDARWEWSPGRGARTDRRLTSERPRST